jgi:hypothetical protein
MSLTTNPNDPCLNEGKKEIGQNECYLVLSEEERAKGFIRPYRDSYIHRGRYYGDRIEILDKVYVSEYTKKSYVAMAKVLDSNGESLGSSYLTQEELDQHRKTGGYIRGCGALTRMGSAIAETYARNPKFYGATFCVGCNKHIGLHEFVWDGTNEVVGS